MAHIDQKLLASCKKGVIEAQMEFYDMLFDPLFRTAGRIVGDRSEAQDIVQESFLKIFDRMDKYEDNPQAVQYALRRIVINASIDALRRRRVTFVDINDAQYVAEEEPDDDKELTMAKIKAAMDKLAPGFKLVLTLRLLEEMEFDDIAERLHISASSVRSQYIRAKQKIRTLI